MLQYDSNLTRKLELLPLILTKSSCMHGRFQKNIRGRGGPFIKKERHKVLNHLSYWKFKPFKISVIKRRDESLNAIYKYEDKNLNYIVFYL